MLACAAARHLIRSVSMHPWLAFVSFWKLLFGGTGYVLKSLGSDGKEGGEGDAADLVADSGS